MKEIIEKMKDINLCENMVTVKSRLNKESEAKLNTKNS